MFEPSSIDSIPKTKYNVSILFKSGMTIEGTIFVPESYRPQDFLNNNVKLFVPVKNLYSKGVRLVNIANIEYIEFLD